jgi:hypothetical protein
MREKTCSGTHGSTVESASTARRVTSGTPAMGKRKYSDSPGTDRGGEVNNTSEVPPRTWAPHKSGHAKTDAGFKSERNRSADTASTTQHEGH